MPSTPIFSNKPRFLTHIASVGDCMSIPVFNAFAEVNPNTCSAANCADTLEGALFRKNIIHQVIRVGGKPSEMNFFMDVFGSTPMNVDSKTIYNHYITDMDYNIQPAAAYAGPGPGLPFWIQLQVNNHSGGGQYSYPQVGFMLFDKTRRITYNITDADTSIPYAHKFQLTPLDGKVTGSVRPNVSYLIGDARLVGGYSCPVVTNAAQSLGYVQAVNPFRVRRDWCVQVDLERGYQDIIQFAVIYDKEGNPQDAWDLYEAQMCREGIRSALNILCFIGTPITNQSLITGTGAVVDSQHTGFYGFLPNLFNGGAVVQDFDPAVGYDLDADLVPLLLYQDSLKRCSEFMVKHGKAWKAGLIERTNKLVARTQVGTCIFEGYKRSAETRTTGDVSTDLAKLGLKSFEFLNFHMDFWEWSAMSDYRYFGNDYYNNLAIGVPMDGVTEAGKPINPVEFYQYGNTYSGGYEEFRRDNRVINGCESFEGYAAQSLMMAVHGQNQFWIGNPVSSC